MSFTIVPSVTGLPPYTDFLCLPLSPCKGGWTCHSWHSSNNSFNNIYNIRGLGWLRGVTLPVTKMAHMALDTQLSEI